jgi:hypothetical protein
MPRCNGLNLQYQTTADAFLGSQSQSRLVLDRTRMRDDEGVGGRDAD